MPRIYPFANALRIRKNIKPIIPDVEDESINLITIAPWIELVDKYTTLTLSEYSIEDMIRRYISGEITIDNDDYNIHYTDENIEILSFIAAPRKIRMDFKEDHVINDYLLAFLEDDVVYDKADSWYILYEQKAVSKEILFHYKNKALWYHLINDLDSNTIQKCNRKFLKFCFDYLKKEEIYKILPVSNIDINISKANKIENLGKYNKYRFFAKERLYANQIME